MSRTTLDQTPGDSHGRSRRVALTGLALATAISGAVVAGAAPASAGSATSPQGTISSADSTVPARNTCATYTWSYAMTPPPGRWALETFVVDPSGVTVASDVVLGGYSPGGNQSSDTFQLCRNSTTPGLFTLRGTFSVDDGTGRVTTSQMTPATFVLGKPTRAAKTADRTGKTKAQQRKAEKRKAERRKKQRQRDAR